MSSGNISKLDILNISKLDILNKIKSLESNINNPGLRKANITDITKNINKKIIIPNKTNEKIKGYREQEEFGEKKFIKP